MTSHHLVLLKDYSGLWWGGKAGGEACKKGIVVSQARNNKGLY